MHPDWTVHCLLGIKTIMEGLATRARRALRAMLVLTVVLTHKLFFKIQYDLFFPKTL